MVGKIAGEILNLLSEARGLCRNGPDLAAHKAHKLTAVSNRPGLVLA
jgi:hypothetical protein